MNGAGEVGAIAHQYPAATCLVAGRYSGGKGLGAIAVTTGLGAIAADIKGAVGELGHQGIGANRCRFLPGMLVGAIALGRGLAAGQ